MKIYQFPLKCTRCGVKNNSTKEIKHLYYTRVCEDCFKLLKSLRVI